MIICLTKRTFLHLHSFHGWKFCRYLQNIILVTLAAYDVWAFWNVEFWSLNSTTNETHQILVFGILAHFVHLMSCWLLLSVLTPPENSESVILRGQDYWLFKYLGGLSSSRISLLIGNSWIFRLLITIVVQRFSSILKLWDIAQSVYSLDFFSHMKSLIWIFWFLFMQSYMNLSYLKLPCISCLSFWLVIPPL